MKREISKREICSLVNICRTAARRYRDQAEILEEIAKKGGSEPISELEASQLAEILRMQADEADDLMGHFAQAEPFEIEMLVE